MDRPRGDTGLAAGAVTGLATMSAFWQETPVAKVPAPRQTVVDLVREDGALVGKTGGMNRMGFVGPRLVRRTIWMTFFPANVGTVPLQGAQFSKSQVAEKVARACLAQFRVWKPIRHDGVVGSVGLDDLAPNPVFIVHVGRVVGSVDVSLDDRFGGPLTPKP